MSIQAETYAKFIEFIGKASDIILQMRFDYKNFIMFESVQNQTNSQFSIILANQLYKIKKKLIDNFTSKSGSSQKQVKLIIQFLFTDKVTGKQYLAEQWKLKMGNSNTSTITINESKIDLKLAALLRSVLSSLTSLPLWQQFIQDENQRTFLQSKYIFDYKIIFEEENDSEKQFNSILYQKKNLTNIGEFSISVTYPQKLIEIFQASEEEEQGKLTSAKNPTSNIALGGRQRFATEDNIQVKGKDGTNSNNTTQDTIDSFKSQQKKELQYRKASFDFQNNQVSKPLHSIVSMYSKKDDITIISSQDDEFTMKILNESGNELEIDMILDPPKEENEFVLMECDEKENENSKQEICCEELKKINNKLTSKINKQSNNTKNCLEEIQELSNILKLF